MEESLIENILALASGDSGGVSESLHRRPHFCTPTPPTIDFEWNGQIEGRLVRRLDSPESQGLAKENFLRGLTYLHNWAADNPCSTLFSFTTSLIRQVHLGETSERRLLVTASSPQDLGVVWFAGSWDNLEPQRIAANALHEAVHQVLYRREIASASILRRNSIAYSPWKNKERPGRWVWHAFWTFSLHCIFLAEVIEINGARILRRDVLGLQTGLRKDKYLRFLRNLELLHQAE